MALIECPECGKQVSDKAESCPHCGNPLRGKADVVGGRQVRAIEKTAKRFKAHILLSTLALLTGVVWMIGSCSASESESMSPWAMLLTVVAAIWLLAAKISAWWHHG
ncbi:MAG: zinc-ribbon domain-containing protein [Planctomycetes bacterium]|nr:zinc-ribbon domain-containing protein [Planctomycetota bacterium]